MMKELIEETMEKASVRAKLGSAACVEEEASVRAKLGSAACVVEVSERTSEARKRSVCG